jgi:hypothetical protein
MSNQPATERCPDCGLDYTVFKGHSCVDPDDIFEVSGFTPNVSDPDVTLEELIEKASVPNLAALYQKGRESGVLKPGVEYGGASN